MRTGMEDEELLEIIGAAVHRKKAKHAGKIANLLIKGMIYIS